MPYGVVDLRTGIGQYFRNIQLAKAFQQQYPHAIIDNFNDPEVVHKFLRYKKGQAYNRAKVPLTVYACGLVTDAGNGACAVHVVDRQETTEIAKAFRKTTQERMDLMSVIVALESIEDKDKARPVTLCVECRTALESLDGHLTADLQRQLQELKDTFDRLSVKQGVVPVDLHSLAFNETTSYFQYADPGYEMLIGVTP